MKDGGPAFPIMGDMRMQPSPGMTILDKFAEGFAYAMTESPELMKVVTASDITDGTAARKVAVHAFDYAEAMIAEREKRMNK